MLEEELIEGVGPSLGAVVSTGLYMTLRLLNYEDVNGSADEDETHLRKAARQPARDNPQVHAEPGSLAEEHAGANEIRTDNV